MKSNCCDAPIIPETDVCSACKEHCEPIKDTMKEVTKKDLITEIRKLAVVVIKCRTPFQAEQINIKLKWVADKLEALDPWISVEDRLPEVGEWVLCSNEFDKWTDFADINHNGHGKKVFWNRECEIYPTHWQPLPNPPKT